jgi:hypothetical protein
MKTPIVLALVLTASLSLSGVAQSQNTEWFLKSGDVVSVYEWRNPDLTRARIIIVDGKVDLPFERSAFDNERRFLCNPLFLETSPGEAWEWMDLPSVESGSIACSDARRGTR